MVATWPNVSALNYWEALPQLQNPSAYTWISNAGNAVESVGGFCTTPVNIREKQVSFGVYKWAQTTFKIDPTQWTNAFSGGQQPKPRDTLTDDSGNVWSVARVDLPDNGSPWRLACVRLIVESTLCDAISIKKPVDSTDAYLSPLTAQGAPSGPETNIPCRIQFDREETEDFQGIQFMRSWYRIYVQNLDDNLQIGTVVEATAGEYNGTTFRVISNDNIEQIEELEMLTVTIDPVA